MHRLQPILLNCFRAPLFVRALHTTGCCGVVTPVANPKQSSSSIKSRRGRPSRAPAPHTRTTPAMDVSAGVQLLSPEELPIAGSLGGFGDVASPIPPPADASAELGQGGALGWEGGGRLL